MRLLPGTRRRRFAAALAVVFAASVVLSGCSAGYADASGDGGTTAQRGAPRAADVANADESATTTTEDQALVITGTITITADDPIAASEQAGTIVTSAGGRVDALSQQAGNDDTGATATLTLRIPADKLDEVRAKLGELGTVDDTSFETVGVGGKQRELDARITTLRTTIARYTTWLAAASTTADLLSLESAMAERQTELESLEAQQRELADQVAMSTITLTLRSDASAAPTTGPTNFWEGLMVGWNAFAGFWAAVAVGLGVGFPWLVALGVILTVVVMIARRAARRPLAVPPSAVAGVPFEAMPPADSELSGSDGSPR